MRRLVWAAGASLLLVAVVGVVDSVAGEETDSPYRGELRESIDAEGRISITVPVLWMDKELAQDQVLRVYARGGGGHDIMVERRKNQADVDELRDAFLKHDAAAMAGSTVKKIGTPFFGYRVMAPAQKRVILRAFAADGPDGLVLTISSRFARYEQLYAEKLAWVASTLKVAGVRTGTGAGDSVGTSGVQRIHDKDGLFSVLAPPGWKAAELKGDESLSIAPGGRATGARILVKYWGDNSNASLVLTKVASHWKQNHRAAALERLQGDPPRLIAKGRQGDSIDYFIGIANGAKGYTVRLVVREGSYERLRTIADEMANSLVFLTAQWSEPVAPDLDLNRMHRKTLGLHGAAEQAGSLDVVASEFDRFVKQWKRFGFGFDRKAPPIHVVVCAADDFDGTASLFGSPPAGYNRQDRLIIVIPPPADPRKLAEWRGALDYALTEALLHRDLKVSAPPWLRRGLANCMRASGLQSGKPDGEVPALVGMLLLRSGKKWPERLVTVRGWSEGDFLRDELQDKQAHAWGYVNFMLFGKGALSNTYKKWKKALLKATRRVPKFDVKKYSSEQPDLQAYVAKRWGDADK